MKQRNRNGIYLKCKACNKEFYVPYYRRYTAKFCSQDCQNHKQYEKFIFNCLNCNKEVITSPSRRNYKSKKFCSDECKNANAMSSRERRLKQKAMVKLTRGTNGSRGLRKQIFRIKEARCQVCDYHEYDFCIDLHHIDNNPNNNVLENIAILCVICHRKLHKGIIILPTRSVKMKHEKKEHHVKHEDHKHMHHHHKEMHKHHMKELAHHEKMMKKHEHHAKKK